MEALIFNSHAVRWSRNTERRRPPRSQRLTPTLSDPELERRLRRGLAKARELLARRGSTAILKCVLVTIPHGEAFWLGEGN